MMEEVLTAKQWRANVRKEQRHREKLEIIAERQRERERAIKVSVRFRACRARVGFNVLP